MIAQRFRALGWGAGIASAACCLYLVSVQVAAERARLEAVDAKIAAAEREMRQLQTELGTRSSMRQLEKWNGETLAMAAPRARQYLKGEYQLASLSDIDVNAPSAPPVAYASVEAVPPKLAPNVSHATFVTLDEPKAEPAKRKMVDRATLADVTREAAREGKQRR